MSVSRIATRYAKSLIDLSDEQGKLERILEDIKSFQEAVENRDFYMMLKSPIINITKKKQIFDAVFGEKFDEMTMAFIKIVLTKNREAALPEIADEFMIQYKAIKSVSTVKLTTATPMTDEALEKIKERFLDSSSTRKSIEIISAVNPDLLGGYVIEFDDKLYHASVAHKLSLLRKEFTKNEYVKK